MKNGLHLYRIALCILPLCLSACVAPEGQAEGAPFELDQVSAERAELTTGVKAALVADERVSAASLNVVLDKSTELPENEKNGTNGDSGDGDSAETGRDVLRLEGFVNDEAERNAALETARKASQGLEVVDGLEIR